MSGTWCGSFTRATYSNHSVHSISHPWGSAFPVLVSTGTPWRAINP